MRTVCLIQPIRIKPNLQKNCHQGSAITDQNVKDKLTTDIGVNATGDSEETLVDNTPCQHQFDALNVFVKSAISDISETRAELGSIQNRLEHTIRNLDNIAENTTATESSIRDTDMAAEMVKYSNNSIIAQAGQTLLAQANQSKQGVLALLLWIKRKSMNSGVFMMGTNFCFQTDSPISGVGHIYHIIHKEDAPYRKALYSKYS